jgi:Protein of unknown function (DUF3306)
MSEPETFVARWSRLKREAEKAAAEEEPSKPRPEAGVVPATAAGETPQRETANREGASEPAFDPASLPSVESITAGTDIRDFLRSGVPADLTRAALRRAWAADPAIRDFIGIAENQWDFTDPTAIPGFGPLQATDNVGELVAQAMGKARDTAERLAQGSGAAGDATAGPVHRTAAPVEEHPVTGMHDVGSPVENASQLPAGEGVAAEQSPVDVAVQDNPRPAKSLALSNRRGHGSALPQ